MFVWLAPDQICCDSSSSQVGQKLYQKSIIFLIDASGSMTRVFGGRRLWDLAVDEIVKAVEDGLRPSDLVGIRVFGNRVSQLERDKSCLDTSLILPIGRHSSKVVRSALERVQPMGLTPLALSTSKIREDFGPLSSKTNRRVIIVTDGSDSCGGDLASSIEDLRKSGLHATFSFVGLMLDLDARRSLEKIAESSDGITLFVDDSIKLRELSRVLAESSNQPINKMSDSLPKNLEGPFEFSLVGDRDFAFSCHPGDKFELSVQTERGRQVVASIFEGNNLIFSGKLPILSELLGTYHSSECRVHFSSDETIGKSARISGTLSKLVDVR